MEKFFLFTVDVETHSPNLKKNGALWIGEQLEKLHLQGTFFFPCKEMENNIPLVEKLISQKHEIASHGFSHRGIYTKYNLPFLNQLEGKEAEEEIRKSYDCFKAKGIPVSGYRAPALHIQPEQLQIVGKYFKYDSSWNYLKNGKYKRDYLQHVKEFPVSYFKIPRLLTGTPYLLWGGLNFWRFMQNINQLDSPIIFYCHSFDFIDNAMQYHPKLSYFRRKIYYKYCGEKGQKFILALLKYLVKEKWKFLTCNQYVSRLCR